MSDDPFVDLICRLEQARHENATAFVMVTVDNESHTVAHAAGPFADAEQALIEAANADAEWKKFEPDDPGDWSYVVVPLWAPGE